MLLPLFPSATLSSKVARLSRVSFLAYLCYFSTRSRVPRILVRAIHFAQEQKHIPVWRMEKLCRKRKAINFVWKYFIQAVVIQTGFSILFAFLQIGTETKSGAARRNFRSKMTRPSSWKTPLIKIHYNNNPNNTSKPNLP